MLIRPDVFRTTIRMSFLTKLGPGKAACQQSRAPSPAASCSHGDGEAACFAVPGVSAYSWLWPGRQRSCLPRGPGYQRLQPGQSQLPTILCGCSQPRPQCWAGKPGFWMPTASWRRESWVPGVEPSKGG
uniref:Uncharacterized protein n=1 Tax=Pipistrellus kuhlii TaxID=59472 RepID=A0A7J7YMA1_PIPKU|nr:hypothetical protein mPipKuh1_010088 [Pipistrellus kuhlii]